MTLEDEISAAHTAVSQWERETFHLGSAFNHCSKLRSFVPSGGELEAALAAGIFHIDMPSEYHAPRFVQAEED